MESFFSIFIAVSALLAIIICRIGHQPVIRLTRRKQFRIKEKGLLHFTSISNAEVILQKGQITGHLSQGSKDEPKFGPTIWFYPYKGNNVDSARKKLTCTKKYKDDPSCYSACLLVTDLDNVDFSCFRGRLQDDSCIYRGDQITGHFDLLKTWKD